MRPLEIEAADVNGNLVANAKPTFVSSDDAVVSVSSDGVARGIRRGSARIDAAIGQAKASLIVKVTARLAIEYALDPGAVSYFFPVTTVAVGDTVPLMALFVDVDGKQLNDRPVVTWESDNPAVASVDSLGVMIARQYGAGAKITATDLEATARMSVSVNIPLSGSPATVRFAHAADGLGPVTFLPTKGSEATVRFGEWIDMQVPPGMLQLTTLGFPISEENWRSTQTAILRGGEVLTFYVLGSADRAGLVPAWTTRGSLPSDSARVVLVQAMVDPLSVVYLRAPDEPAAGLAEECYFDPGDVSEHYWRPPGIFDLVLQPKYGGAAQVRLKVEVQGGRGYTVVFTGTLKTSVGRLVFPDP